jgi:hypothetical protein
LVRPVKRGALDALRQVVHVMVMVALVSAAALLARVSDLLCQVSIAVASRVTAVMSTATATRSRRPGAAVRCRGRGLVHPAQQNNRNPSGCNLVIGVGLRQPVEDPGHDRLLEAFMLDPQDAVELGRLCRPFSMKAGTV